MATQKVTYNAHNLLKFAVYYGVKAAVLRKLLQRFKTTDNERVTLELFLCKRRSDIPKNVSQIKSGRYKLIPWVVAMRSESKIYFHAPFFVSFLVLRMVLLPCLKRDALLAGGIVLSGSVFLYRNRTFLVSGKPGSGKTYILLTALEQGAQFLSDHEMIVRPDRTVLRLFNEIELRYDTIRKTKYWQQLDAPKRIRLWLYNLLSLATGRSITFGLLISPEEIGIHPIESAPFGELYYIWLDKETDVRTSSPSEITEHVLRYEDWYTKRFGSFVLPSDWNDQVRKRLEQFLGNASFLVSPTNVSAETVLNFKRN